MTREAHNPMTGSVFDWMVSNHAVWGWKAQVKASVSGVSLLQLSPFFASIFPLLPQKRLILRLTQNSPFRPQPQPTALFWWAMQDLPDVGWGSLCASGQYVILGSSGDTTNAYPWLLKGCVIKQGNFCHNLRPCEAFNSAWVSSRVKVFLNTLKNQFHFYCSLQRNPIQYLRKFLLPVLSWILLWWQLLHLAHNCSRTKHNSLDLSRISSEWSSHLWGLLCWDFWRKWRHCTLYRQVLRL